MVCSGMAVKARRLSAGRGEFRLVKAVPVRLGRVGSGLFRFGMAVTVWWGIVCCFAVGQGGHSEVGHGPFRHGEVSRVGSRRSACGWVRRGMARWVPVWRSLYGAVCCVTVSRGTAVN